MAFPEEKLASWPSLLRDLYASRGDSSYPSDAYMQLVHDQLDPRTYAVGTLSRTLPTGLLQIPAVVYFAETLGGHDSGDAAVDSEHAERMANFRIARQRYAYGWVGTHVVLESAITGLPPSLRRAQVQHLAHTAGQPEEAAEVLVIPGGTPLPDELDADFTVVRSDQGDTAYIQPTVPVRTIDGVITHLSSGPDTYFQPGTPESQRYHRLFDVLSTLALNATQSNAYLKTTYLGR